MEEEGELWECK
jgi:pentatricopeptide repeat protein